MSKWYALFLIILLPCYSLRGQENMAHGPIQLNFFLDCEDCDFNFVRQELKSISFVRNSELADVHIMSTESGTGSGGRKYFLQFIGAHRFAGKLAEYTYISEPSETDDQTRKALLQLIKAGVLHYHSMAGIDLDVDIRFKEEIQKTDSLLLHDPWDNWIFNIDVGGNFEKEESKREVGYNLGGSADRITRNWKTNVEFVVRKNMETYINEDQQIKNEQQQINLSALTIKSLTSHWSVGAYMGYISDTYLNTKDDIGARIGIEYNIFPWDLCDRKMFAFRYTTGANYRRYFKETIYDKTDEMLTLQTVELEFEFKQPWGEIEMGIEAMHYFHDFSKNNINLETDISVRLSKQLSVFMDLNARVIHDQFYLIKDEGASLEDLLLERRKLATAYEFGGRIGFRFTFGSIYNNVVNERFE